ncbi:hypothetical protein K2X40_00855 [Candidatus Babeliales bacterium]|nr:hypothetical protein [Candidatus Babeliales bacterium]
MNFSKNLKLAALALLVATAVGSELNALDIMPKPAIITGPAQNAVNNIIDEIRVALDKCRTGYPMVKVASRRDETMFFLGCFVNNGPGLPKGTQRREGKIAQAKNIAGKIKTLIESYNSTLKSSSVTASETHRIEQSATSGELRNLSKQFKNLIAEIAPSQGW